MEAGTLLVNNSGALPAGSSLTVGAGGTLIFDPSATGVPLAGGTRLVEPVPEPGTWALLLAGLVVGLAAWRRHTASFRN